MEGHQSRDEVGLPDAGLAVPQTTMNHRRRLWGKKKLGEITEISTAATGEISSWGRRYVNRNSKQRHNKLWRSHSDSNLSEHHEPLVKTPVAQTLGRSNARSQSGTQASPSLDDLLQMLTPTTPTPAGSKDNKESETQEIPISNCLRDAKESLAAKDPPQLSRPWAATGVLEVRPDVAETFSMGRPHTPAFIHHLTLLPIVLSDIEAKQIACEQPSSVMLEEKCSPQVPSTEYIRNKTPEASRQAPNSSSATGLPTQVPEYHGEQFSQQVPDTDVDCTEIGHTSDNHLHSSASLQEAGFPSLLPSAVSTDQIHFFSAREKFLGLSEEGQTHGNSDQAVQQTPRDRDPNQESKLLLTEGPVREDEDHKKKSCSVLIYDVFSELESPTPLLPPTSQSVSSSFEEKEEVVTTKGANMEKAKLGEDLQNDWPKSTVLQATRHLEQKMKHDVSSHTCTLVLHSTLSTSSRDRTEDTSLLTDLTSDPSIVSAHHHQPESTVEEKMEKEESSPIEAGIEKGCKIRLREEDYRHTGISEKGMNHFHSRQRHSTQSSSSPAVVLQLEGVTEEESSTDCPSEHSLVMDMREIWETLKELGAFLCQVSGRSDKRPSQPWAVKEQKRGQSVQGRAKEVEARIRQAGLTPPSLMKRSASLAKLDSLELSASDLTASVSPHTIMSRLQPFTYDTSKKKHVLPRYIHTLSSSCTSDLTSIGLCENKMLEDHQIGEGGCRDSNKFPTPPPVTTVSKFSRQGKVWDPSNAPVPSPALISVATRQQYGKTHPLRRLKKWTLNFPYHTV